MKIAVVGSGYVGLIAAVCFAELGHQVVCVDIDRARVATLVAGEVPIYEERLPELLAKHRGHRLSFTTDLTIAARESEAIFIAVGTPQLASGEADLSQVEASVSEIAAALGNYKMIVEKSTVPVLTPTAWIRLAHPARQRRPARRTSTSFQQPGVSARGHGRGRLPLPDRFVVIGADQRAGARPAGAAYLPSR